MRWKRTTNASVLLATLGRTVSQKWMNVAQILVRMEAPAVMSSTPTPAPVLLGSLELNVKLMLMNVAPNLVSTMVPVLMASTSTLVAVLKASQENIVRPILELEASESFQTWKIF